MTKRELLKKLSEHIKLEEASIPLYAKHIKNTLFLSGFNRERADKILQVLDILRIGSTNHKEKIEQLINTISKSDKDVY